MQFNLDRLEELGISVDSVNRLLDRDCIEIGRQAVENAVIELRDCGVSMMCGNGISCREKDGTPSSMIRMRTDNAIMTALKAMLGAIN